MNRLTGIAIKGLVIFLVAGSGGGIGAAVAVTQVPQLRDALKGQTGELGPRGEPGQQGPAGPIGRGMDSISGGMIAVSGLCPAGTSRALINVVSDVTLNEAVFSSFDNRQLVPPSIQTSTLSLCRIN